MALPRRVVLSRKGFDSGTGCVPSPIFSDGTMLSLPIPDRAGTVAYGDLRFGSHRVGKLVTDLKSKVVFGKVRKHLTAEDHAHLDPDLLASLRDRPSGWRPAFGQCGSAATILHRHGVGEGDLFLFFGWFRNCELADGMYRFVPGAPDLHVIFGYLRIGEVIRLSTDPAPDWAQDHPHLHGTARKSDHGNTLFVAAESLGLPGLEHLPGAGLFPVFSTELQLTAQGKSKSLWRLPAWFHPVDGRTTLSSHHDPGRWRLEQDSCLLQSVGRGQEFIVDAEALGDVVGWAAAKIASMQS